MRTILQDLRYGWRVLLEKPAFTTAAVLSLAVGIGAVTTMFSLADAVLLRPLPVSHPGEIVRLFSSSKAEPLGAVSYPDFLDFRKQTATLSGLSGFSHIPVALSENSSAPAQMRLGIAVTEGFFDVLGVKPALGRVFRPDEDRQQVAILANSFWASQFGRDPSVIGRQVRLSNLDFTVVGVAPANFTGLNIFVHEEIYVPMGVRPRLSPDGKNTLEQRDHGAMFVYGRLQNGRTQREAQAELATIASRLELAYPGTNRGRGAMVLTETEARKRSDPENGPLAALLLAIGALVLSVACANVANLLLVRARGRSREIAIRLAIGAGRWRLCRQLLTESLLLSAIGGVAGLFLASLGMQFVSSIRLPTGFPVGLSIPMDRRVLIFSAAASLLSGLLFGLAPALEMFRTNLSGTLKAGDLAVSSRRKRFPVRNILVAGQFAVSMILLIAAGLVTKDFSRAVHFNPGFRTDHLLVVTLDPALVRYKEPETRAFYKQLIDRARALPGVRSVALGEHLPLGITSSIKSVVVDGYQMQRDQQNLSIQFNAVDDQYFTTMRIPILEGRAFNNQDQASSQGVAIVNRTMAQRYWPKGNAVGSRIRVGDRTAQVVGIAQDIKYHDITETPLPFLYLPFSQEYEAHMTLHIETAGDPASMAGPVMAEIRRLDPAQPIALVQTMDRFFDELALFGNRLVMQSVGTIGLFGLLLAIIGLYGVISYSVSRRTREIGIRIAIGAARKDVLRMILRQGAVMMLAGAAIGGGLAFLAAPVLESQLVGVAPRDISVFAVVTLVLCGAGFVACYIPARRAARVEPVVALRNE